MSDSRALFSIKSLSPDMIRCICEFLIPEDIESLLLSYSDAFSALMQDRLAENLWASRLDLHFKHSNSELEALPPNATSRQKFVRLYHASSNTPGNRRLSSIAKEGDTEALRVYCENFTLFQNLKDLVTLVSDDPPLVAARQRKKQEWLNFLYREYFKNKSIGLSYQSDMVRKPLDILWIAIDTLQPISELEVLIGNGSSLTQEFPFSKAQPIHLAAQCGHLDFVIYILKQNPLLLEVKDSKGFTPLFYAIVAGQVDVVTFLLSVGACEWRTTGSNVNALQESVISNQLGLVEAILALRPNLLGHVDSNGDSILDQIAMYYPSTKSEIIEYLLNKRCPYKSTAFLTALQYNNFIFIHAILQKRHDEALERIIFPITDYISQQLLPRRFERFMFSSSVSYDKYKWYLAAKALLKVLLVNDGDLSPLAIFEEALNEGYLGTLYNSSAMQSYLAGIREIKRQQGYFNCDGL